MKKKFKSLDGSYYLLDNQDYFKYTIKKDEIVTYNPPIK